MIHFQQPLALLLFLPLAAAALALLRPRRVSALLFAPAAWLPAPTPGWRVLAANLVPFLWLAGIALCIIALARPQTILSKSSRRSDAIAIQMAVDVSGSMQALDLSLRDKTRTRLDAVKEEFARFVSLRPDDLVGLVTFGGFATSRVPLTLDHAALLHVLSGVQIPRQNLGSDGRVANEEELLTAVGDGLATACARIADAPVKSRIVVLLSDGESNTGVVKPLEAAKAAKALGIKVYTIGVGSNGKAPFMARDMFGSSFVVYHPVSIDEKTLSEIAGITGGRYFNVRDHKGMEQALNEISKLEKTRIDREVFNLYREWAAWLLAPAAALIALAAIMGMTITRAIA